MSRYDLTREEIAQIFTDVPAYRAVQLWQGLYRRLAAPQDIAELPCALRDALASDVRLHEALSLLEAVTSTDGLTTKFLFALTDGARIETVLMHHPRHSTVCISSQAGCAMACSFCATGQAGYNRQLSVGEIVEQVVVAARLAGTTGRRLDHVVFMGMGEPFANYDAVWAAVERIVGDLGIGARHLTLSTVGVIPGIVRLAREQLQVNLVISLHAANDRLRNELVPLNRRYPIDALVGACATYVEQTHRRISLEWAMIADCNDHDSDAIELAAIARHLRAHVNLIPLNPTPENGTLGLNGSPPAQIRSFRDALLAEGVNVTVRRTRGREIAAACGQLARTTDNPDRPRRLPRIVPMAP